MSADHLPVKIRLEGRPSDVEEFADWLASAPGVIVFNRSRPYSNRGNSGWIRVYLDVTTG